MKVPEPGRRSQVVRQRSAKPLFVGSIPTAASINSLGEFMPFTRTGSSLRGPGILLVLGVALQAAPAAERPAGDRAPAPQTRRVVITDSHCGVEGALRADHRVCALECASEGERLLIYDPKRRVLFEIDYASEELRVQVLNDFAGLPAVARGHWDDQGRRVALHKIFPAPEPGPAPSHQEAIP